MAIKDNFGNPKGMIGRIMLSGMNMGHSPMAKWAFTQIEVPKRAVVLDIGCGGGFNIRRLLERCPEGQVYGVDISEVSVAKSKKVNKKDLGTRCEIYQATAENLPFDDESLDMATAFETVYFWKDLTIAFTEVLRTLKPGGMFYIINDPGDPNKHWDEIIPDMTSYPAEEIEEALKTAGFEDAEVTRNKYMFCVKGKRPVEPAKH